jgi:hypothetical protein
MKAPDNKEKVVSVAVRDVISAPLKYSVVSDTEVALTKEQAYQFLELETFEGERQVNERHVQNLFNQWAAGRFMWEHVIIGTCDCNGHTYRINGQHTCWMRVNITKDIDPKVRVMHYKVNDAEQLRALYCVFDRAKSRTPSHIVRASLSGTRLAAELWPSVLDRLTSGFRMWRWDNYEEWNAIQPEDLVTLVEGEYNNIFRVVGFCFQELYEWKYIRKAAIIAAMFATFSVSVKASLEFWRAVGAGLGLDDRNDARYKLRRYLEDKTQSKDGMSKKDRVTSEETYRASVHCWNHWRKGTPIVAGIKLPNKRPKAI